jgi:hypothetical protein
MHKFAFEQGLKSAYRKWKQTTSIKWKPTKGLGLTNGNWIFFVALCSWGNHFHFIPNLMCKQYRVQFIVKTRIYHLLQCK